MAQFLVGQLEPCMGAYQEVVGMLDQAQAGGQQPAGELLQRKHVVEGQLTWMTYIIGAVIGGLSWNTAPSNEGEEAIDARLCSLVFQLAQGVDLRLAQSNGHGKCDQRLEVAIIYFFQFFRKVYLVDSYGSSMHSLYPSIVMGGALNPLHGGESVNRTSMKQKSTQQMFEHMGLGDQTQIISIIINKIGNNLKYWSDADDVLIDTLTLFLELSSANSGKMLLGLEPVQFLIQNHTPDHFPFLMLPQNCRHRTTFHATLTRLIFHQPFDDMQRTFGTFMEPTLQLLGKLGATENLRAADARQAIIGVCRDLRGITQATTNKRTYCMLFDMLYPAFFTVFTRSAEAWFDDPEVTTALLKFIMEFVSNKANRVNFDNSSPNGILLFRETSSIVCAYGSRILVHQVRARLCL